MFGMRWHDLYGMCIRRPSPPVGSAVRARIAPVAAGAAPPGAFAWWRVHVYYGLAWQVGLG